VKQKINPAEPKILLIFELAELCPEHKFTLKLRLMLKCSAEM